MTSLETTCTLSVDLAPSIWLVNWDERLVCVKPGPNEYESSVESFKSHCLVWPETLTCAISDSRAFSLSLNLLKKNFENRREFPLVWPMATLDDN